MSQLPAVAQLVVPALPDQTISPEAIPSTDGAVTVTVTSLIVSAVQPAPAVVAVAVTWYVVVALGVTDVEPPSHTYDIAPLLPVVLTERVAELPIQIVDGDADAVTVPTDASSTVSVQLPVDAVSVVLHSPSLALRVKMYVPAVAAYAVGV